MQKPERVYNDPDTRKFSLGSYFNVKWILISLLLMGFITIMVTYSTHGLNPSTSVIETQIIKVLVIGTLTSPLVEWSIKSMMHGG